MQDWQAQMFDVILAGAIRRFFERLASRFGSEDEAAARLSAPDAEIFSLAQEFSGAMFAEASLDTPAGSCFVLEALQGRKTKIAEYEGDVGELLAQTARRCFADLLVSKASEAAQLSLAYGFEGAEL